jgi:hypothetical protein
VGSIGKLFGVSSGCSSALRAAAKGLEGAGSIL